MQYCVHISDFDLLKSIKDWAAKKGWFTSYKDDACVYLNIDTEKQRIDCCKTQYTKATIVTLDVAIEVINALEVIATISDYKVFKIAGGIKVGCVRVAAEKIVQIYKAIHARSYRQSYQLYIPDPFLLKQFLIWATKIHGWRTDDRIEKTIWDSMNFVILKVNDKLLAGTQESRGYIKLSLDAAINLVKADRIICQVGEFDVVQIAGGVRIGAVFVNTSQIEALYDKVCVFNKQEKVGGNA